MIKGCILPWMHLYGDVRGKYNLCCHISGSLDDMGNYQVKRLAMILRTQVVNLIGNKLINVLVSLQNYKIILMKMDLLIIIQFILILGLEINVILNVVFVILCLLLLGLKIQIKFLNLKIIQNSQKIITLIHLSFGSILLK